MTALSNTFYAVSSFLALVALLLWAKRRRRMSQMARRAITQMARD